VIDRLMALEGDEIDLEKLKWVVLMVLFSQPGRKPRSPHGGPGVRGTAGSGALTAAAAAPATDAADRRGMIVFGARELLQGI